MDKYLNKKVAVLGLGIEGVDAINFLLAKGAKITLFEQKENKNLDFEGIQKAKIKIVSGKNYLSGGLKDFDYIVRSPGIYRFTPEIVEAEASGAKVTSAIKIFFEECPGKIIGVTGTKGKGTTSTLIYRILETSGKEVYLVGNIGKPYLQLLPKLSDKSWVIVELSSFQLIDMKASPHIAVVLNITQDHLDWHKDREEYLKSKENIVKYQNKNDWAVLNSEYKISKDAEPIGETDIANLTYTDLSEELKDKFDSYALDLVILENATLDEVEEMFVRLQNGSTLKAAERRNALPGKMKLFIRELAKHNFFNSCGFKNRRFDFDQVAAQCMLLELNGGVRNIKNTDLEKMYLENEEFDFESPEAKKINKVLNYLEKTFPEKTPELKQGNVISLYIIISMLLEKYAISDFETKIGKWFIDFETKRFADLDLPEDQRDSEMVAYQNAVGHSSDSIESLEYRNKLLSRDLFSFFPGLKPLDNNRDFSYEQKLAIFRRDNGICQLKIKCSGKKMGWDDDWHVDHKIPYSKGGLTTVENGQVACAECNLAKGSGD